MLLPSFLLFIQLLVLSLALGSTADLASNSASVESLISKGDRFRSEGHIKNALQTYDDAIRLDPNNYLVLFKRGAVYMSMPGKEASAIADLGKVLQLRPSFAAALRQRSGLYLRLGQLDNATKDAKSLKNIEKKSAKQEDGEAKTLYSDQLMDNINTVSQLTRESSKLLKKKDFDQCSKVASAGLDISPSSTELLKTRIVCNLKQGKTREVVRDLNNLELYTHDEQLYAQDALINYYALHKFDTARSKLQRCLQLNMDSKPCQSAFIDIRSFEKKFGKYSGIADTEEGGTIPSDNDNIWKEAKNALSNTLDSEIRKEVIDVYEKAGFPKDLKIIDPNTNSDLLTGLEETLCVAYYNLKLFTDPKASTFCNAVISHEKSDRKDNENTEQSTRPRSNARVIAHIMKAEKLISEELFDQAKESIRQALEYHPNERRLIGLQHDVDNRKVQAKKHRLLQSFGCFKIGQ